MTDAENILSLEDRRAPRVAASAFVARGAIVVGDVVLEEKSSLWYNAVIRADAESIVLGPGSNVQDGCAIHADPGFPAVIGRDVSVGHNAVIHGSTIEDGCLIGMGAILLNGCVIGAGSMVAAGAVVLEGTVVPPGSLVAGVPGKVRRTLTDDEVADIRGNAAIYRRLVVTHRTAR